MICSEELRTSLLFIPRWAPVVADVKMIERDRRWHRIRIKRTEGEILGAQAGGMCAKGSKEHPKRLEINWDRVSDTKNRKRFWRGSSTEAASGVKLIKYNKDHLFSKTSDARPGEERRRQIGKGRETFFFSDSGRYLNTA